MMNREIAKIREVMHRKRIDQGGLAKLLAEVTGKKVGRAAVSRQLNQSKMSREKLEVYWRALGGRPDEEQTRLVGETTGRHDLAEAIRLLTMCNAEQVAKVVGYVNALLDSAR